MRYANFDDCLAKACNILTSLEDKNDGTQTYNHIITHCKNTIHRVMNCPEGERNGPFTKENNRYGYKADIPAVLGETIVGLNLLTVYGEPIKIAKTVENQVYKGIDLFIPINDTTQTVQVKTLRMVGGLVFGLEDLRKGPFITEWVSLVDIDDKEHFFIPTALFLPLLKQTQICHTDLEDISTHFFRNDDLYSIKD